MVLLKVSFISSILIILEPNRLVLEYGPGTKALKVKSYFPFIAVETNIDNRA